ncbi:MAG: S-adenosylmethionine decarboxylase [Candidatus Blackburnbacteria bacterium]|nr:S-adenosylmethionine decarboxylase [Candidatus Blackburnbacteria bacterium]
MSAIQENKRRFHIIIDAFNCDNTLISDKNKIEQVIRDIAQLCGMKLLYGPIVIEGVEENPGVTGFAVIDFSHISMHTFTKDREICIDIFSCKPFDVEEVKGYVIDTLKLSPESIKYIEVTYPQDPSTNSG